MVTVRRRSDHQLKKSVLAAGIASTHISSKIIVVYGRPAYVFPLIHPSSTISPAPHFNAETIFGGDSAL